MTVYLTQAMRNRDFTPALIYGDIVVLVPATEQATVSTLPVVHHMLNKLVKFTDDDYLLLSGDPVAIATAAALAAHYNGGRFKVLKWDRLIERYLPLQINLTLERG